MKPPSTPRLRPRKELAQTQHKFIRDYPGTYMAKFLTWSLAFHRNKGTFLSDIDMSDNSLVRSMALPDRIQSMMRRSPKARTSGFLSCIDIVKASCEENPVVLEFALYNMLDGFYNMKATVSHLPIHPRQLYLR